MGKASKWIINFLIGKHEKKKEKVLNQQSQSFTSITKAAGTPRVKRRWSFGKSAGKEASHKFSKSVDSIDTTKLPLKVQQINHAMPLARDVENNAATRIQASFRSYLARKALHALRGLVKLQALIRGHIVRKQTKATVRRMHALMAIQVRARFQRIQMAEAAHVVTKQQSSIQRGFTQDNGAHRKTMDMNPNETQRVSKSPSGYFNHSQTGRIEHGCTTFYSECLSISKRHKYEESPFTTAENSPRIVPAASKPKPTEPSFPFQQHDCVDPLSYDYTFMPNYMANTQSSKAKVRSQSRPKQRPEGSMKHKSKHTELVDATHASMEEDQVLKRSSSHFKPNGLKNHDPSWFVKLYRSRRLFEDSKHASVTPSTSHPNYTEFLDAYEPHGILY